MSDAIPLSPRPHLDQYRKLAKDFQQACRSGGPEAIRAWASWLPSDPKTTEEHWRAFQKSHERGSDCKLTDAQYFIALEHGFASWPKFAKHVEALALANSPVSLFEAAADAIVAGEVAKLEILLKQSPNLVRELSTRAHRSTLLHYISANGVEDFRQKTPPNIIEITTLLLDAGADVNAESQAYGGRSTALGLAATSAHPQKAGVQIDLIQTLLDHGAHIPAGSIRSCLANGQPKAAEYLASRGAPVYLEEAAGLGRVDLVEAYLAADESVDRSAACLNLATYYLHIDVVRLLLKHRWPRDARDREHGATAEEVARHVRSNSQSEVERKRADEIVALLAST